MNAMNIEYRSVELTNVGVLHIKVPQIVMAAIKTEVDQIQTDFSSAVAVNHNLAGNMEREYKIVQSRYQLDPFIMAATDPTSDDYSMPYIYDDFSWVSSFGVLGSCVFAH